MPFSYLVTLLPLLLASLSLQQSPIQPRKVSPAATGRQRAETPASAVKQRAETPAPAVKQRAETPAPATTTAAVNRPDDDSYQSSLLKAFFRHGFGCSVDQSDLLD